MDIIIIGMEKRREEKPGNANLEILRKRNASLVGHSTNFCWELKGCFQMSFEVDKSFTCHLSEACTISDLLNDYT